MIGVCSLKYHRHYLGSISIEKWFLSWYEPKLENFALPTNKPSELDVKIYWDQNKIIELSKRDRPRDSQIALLFSFDRLTERYIVYKSLPLAEPPIREIYTSLASLRSQMSGDVVLGWHGQLHGVPPAVWVEVIW